MSFPWRQPMAYSADLTGVIGASLTEFITQMQAAGFLSLAFYLDSQDTATQVNALRAAGIQVVGWTQFRAGITPSNIVARMSGLALDGVIFNMENDADYTNTILALNNGAGSGLPKSAVVSEGPFDTDGTTRAQVLKSRGITTMQVEVFTDSGHFSAANEINNIVSHTGNVFSASDLFACFSVSHAEVPTTFADTGGVGRDFSMFRPDSGGMYGVPETSQWAAWGAWHGGPAPPPGPLPPPAPGPPPPSPPNGQFVITFSNPPIILS